MWLLAEAWVHNIDPFLFRLPQGFPLTDGIRWYGLSYLVGFLIGYLMIRRVVSCGRSPLKVEQVADLVITLAISIVVGGRLGYVLFYKPDLFIDFTGPMPYWGVFKVNEGGMASHGGMIGALIGCWFYAWRNKLPIAHIADLVAFGGPIGLGFGRIANFINGELYGRAVGPDFPLAVKFPQEMLTWSPADPRFDMIHTALDTSGPGLTLNEQVHALIERIQAGDPALTQAVAQVLTPRHPSQIYLALMEGLAVALVLIWTWRKPRKPWLIAGLFATCYGIVRIIGEFWREPDEHLKNAEFAVLHITRGQVLSAALLLTGFIFIYLSRKTKLPAMGGWMGGEVNSKDDSQSPTAKP